MGDSKRKLYGGAQYHRAIREFTVAVRNMKAPPISEDEIANAAGMGDVHDGVNFMRAACIIAVQKAQQSFEPILLSLRHRAVHIMRRLFPIIENSMQKHSVSSSLGNSHIDSSSGPFKDMIRSVYDKFVDQQIEICIQKCRDDLMGMTRFVTWDTDGRGGSAALYKSLPTPKRMVEIYSVAVESKDGRDKRSGIQENIKSNAQKRKERTEDRILSEWGKAGGENKQQHLVETTVAQREWTEDETQVSEYFELMQVMEEMLAGRQGGRTTTVIITLVQHIISSWRNHFARTVAMKFNCFFLMPFLDDFSAYLRNELDAMYADDVGDLFDISEARQSLQHRKVELMAECDANAKLQRRFDLINTQLCLGGQIGQDESTIVADFDQSWPYSVESIDGDLSSLQGGKGDGQGNVVEVDVPKDNTTKVTPTKRKRRKKESTRKESMGESVVAESGSKS